MHFEITNKESEMTHQKEQEEKARIYNNVNIRRKNRKQINSIKFNHKIEHKDDRILQEKLQNQIVRKMLKI